MRRRSRGNCLGCYSIVGGELESWSGAGGSYCETEGTGGTGGTGERWKRTGNRAFFRRASATATFPSLQLCPQLLDFIRNLSRSRQHVV